MNVKIHLIFNIVLLLFYVLMKATRKLITNYGFKNENASEMLELFRFRMLLFPFSVIYIFYSYFVKFIINGGFMLLMQGRTFSVLNDIF